MRAGHTMHTFTQVHPHLQNVTESASTLNEVMTKIRPAPSYLNTRNYIQPVQQAAFKAQLRYYILGEQIESQKWECTSTITAEIPRKPIARVLCNFQPGEEQSRKALFSDCQLQFPDSL